MTHIGETPLGGAIPREGSLSEDLVNARSYRASHFGVFTCRVHAIQTSPVTTSRRCERWKCCAQRRKSIAFIIRHHLERDEGIVYAARDCRMPHRRGGLAPRCRIVASWGCSRSQGFGCSPIKAVRDLGSERRIIHCVSSEQLEDANRLYR